ncbi:MAG: NTP transferase domain-containing protein [Armatimonadota bacterium]|nr:NTP transferase domain-containing protein [Armatimonadota bacterium]MDR7533777.1 NTP transferase domain-containing protein [Armatimonadota bacterium]MDR7535767.1 NTP transferase domain-containing protein [Armatimonadota bacterium]
MRAIVLAAGRGTRLHPVWAHPKCLLPVAGRPLLARYIDALQRLGVDELVVVTGFEHERVAALAAATTSAAFPVRTIFNPCTGGSVCSLDAARTCMTGEVLLMDGDVFCEDEVLARACDGRGEALVVDPSRPYDSEKYRAAMAGGQAVGMARGLRGAPAAEWVGFARLAPPRTARLAALARDRVRRGDVTAAYEDLLSATIAEAPMPWVSVAGLRWAEIDTPGDYVHAEALARQVAGLRRPRRLLARAKRRP